MAMAPAAMVGVLLALTPSFAEAQEGGGRGRGKVATLRPAEGTLGVGILFGEPSGFTAKLRLTPANALQLHLGYGLRGPGHLVASLDYLFHLRDLLPAVQGVGRIVPYVGAGGRLGIRDEDPLLSLRVPLGLSFVFDRAPVELFLEVAPGVGLLPSTEALVDGGFGGRFYF
jgi:hypothetical protein